MQETHSSRELVVYGAGGLADEVAWLARSLGWTVVGYVVTDGGHLPIRKPELLWGLEADLLAHPKPLAVAVALGHAQRRLEVWQRLQAAGNDNLRFPTLVHRSVQADWDTCVLGPGVVLTANVVLTTNVHVGAGTLINLGCTVGHDARIGAACVLNPGAHVSGQVCMGDGVLIGTGAVVLQQRNIASLCTLGAGAVLTHDMPMDTTWLGIPARRV